MCTWRCRRVECCENRKRRLPLDLFTRPDYTVIARRRREPHSHDPTAPASNACGGRSITHPYTSSCQVSGSVTDGWSITELAKLPSGLQPMTVSATVLSRVPLRLPED